MDRRGVYKVVYVLYLITSLQVCLNEAINPGLLKNKTATDDEDAPVDEDLFSGSHPEKTFDLEFAFTPLIVQRFSINTEYCKLREICDSSPTMLGWSCYCDTLCSVFNDCCENIAEIYNYSENSLAESQFECVRLILISTNKSIEANIVAKCSSDWFHNVTRELCENVNADPDMIALQVHVSNADNIIYRNMYCAYCNFVYDFHFWTVEKRCAFQNGTSRCNLFYEPPLNHSDIEKCRKDDHVSNCSSEYRAEYNEIDVSRKCEEESANYVYAFRDNLDKRGYLFTKYKNKYCAVCNDEDEALLLCHTGETEIPNAFFDKTVYSFRMMVDFNALLGRDNANSFDCKNDHLYDPISQTCRQIFCPKSTAGIQGRCVPRAIVPGNESDCAFIRLKPNEWVFENETLLYIKTLNKMFNSSMFYLNGTDVFLCSDAFTDQSVMRELFYFSSAESYITLCGLILSISALTITLLVYCMFQELLNIPGKILTCLMTSLLLGQLLFLFTSHAKRNATACKALAILVHYFYMASFSWMNVVAFDLLKTFSRSFVASRSDKKSKRFYFYSFYGWFAPFIVVTTSVVVDESNIYISFKPGYGQGSCWITSRNALIMFFVGPLSFFKLIDIIGFICTSCFIARAHQQGSKAGNKKLCSFLVYIKLSIVMGMTWVFAFLAMFSSNVVMWYIFIVFNTLQGVFIAVCFLCTKKVMRLVRKKFSRKLDRTSSSRTTTSSMTKSN